MSGTGCGEKLRGQLPQHHWNAGIGELCPSFGRGLLGYHDENTGEIGN